VSNSDFTQDFIFTDNYLSYPDVIVTSRDDIGGLILDDLAGESVVVVANWPEVALLREQYPEVIRVEVDSTFEGLTRLALGEYDYMLTYLPTASYLMREHGIQGLRIISSEDEPIADAMMVRKEDVTLRNLLDKALKQIDEGERRVMEERWLGQVDLTVINNPPKATADPIVATAIRVVAAGRPCLASMPYWCV
jgi:ABC-type amino acid transport substrate-binding protein